jgi:hypothetical protein
VTQLQLGEESHHQAVSPNSNWNRQLFSVVRPVIESVLVHFRRNRTRPSLPAVVTSIAMRAVSVYALPFASDQVQSFSYSPDSCWRRLAQRRG